MNIRRAEDTTTLRLLGCSVACRVPLPVRRMWSRTQDGTTQSQMESEKAPRPFRSWPRRLLDSGSESARGPAGDHRPSAGRTGSRPLSGALGPGRGTRAALPVALYRPRWHRFNLLRRLVHVSREPRLFCRAFAAQISKMREEDGTPRPSFRLGVGLRAIRLASRVCIFMVAAFAVATLWSYKPSHGRLVELLRGAPRWKYANVHFIPARAPQDVIVSSLGGPLKVCGDGVLLDDVAYPFDAYRGGRWAHR